jgi:hypothetical protein
MCLISKILNSSLKVTLSRLFKFCRKLPLEVVLNFPEKVYEFCAYMEKLIFSNFFSP